MQLGFVSAILGDLRLDDVLAFAAEEEFDCVELMCWPAGKADRRYAGVTHLDVAEFTDSQASHVRGLLKSSGIAVSGLGYYPNPLDPDAAHRQTVIAHLKKVISAAAKLSVPVVNTFVGRDPARSIEDNWPLLQSVWPDIVKQAEASGVHLAIENCPMLFSRDEWPGGKNLATTPVIWRRMFSDIPSKNFGLNYDPSHFVLQQMDPASPLREFRSKLFHLHAKDMTVHPERLNEVGIFAVPKEWHTPRIPGFGAIDWPAFTAVLYEIGYGGAVCIEVEDDTFGKTLKGRKQALNVAKNVLAPFFG